MFPVREVVRMRGCSKERLPGGEVAQNRSCLKERLFRKEVVLRRICQEESLPRGSVAPAPRRLPGGGCPPKFHLMGRILSNISLVFWAMELQEKYLLRFTDLFFVLCSTNRGQCIWSNFDRLNSSKSFREMSSRDLPC